MRKFLKQLKKIFVDNKEYFIRCTLMSVIAALILGLAIGFAVPASAEASTTIIEAGTYRFNDTLTEYPGLSNGDYPLVGFCYGFVLVSENSLIIDEMPFTSFYCGGADFEDGLGTLPSFHFSPETESTIPSFYGEGRGGWLCYYNKLTSSGFSTTGDISLLTTFTVTADAEVDDKFGTWFSANTTKSGDVDPDPYPDPDPVIEAGFYKVRDSWNTSGWPVTNDSIEFRYYDELDQTYIEAEGIAFLIENHDMVSIWYMDNNVYLDGWNIEGAKFIEVTQDITVEPEFYTVFNNVYETSSQGSNEFESGYAAGYNDGFSAGRDVGYNQGYYEGMAESSGNFFTDILGGVLGSLDSFTLFGGYSLLDLITTLLGGFALIWILKLLAGG